MSSYEHTYISWKEIKLSYIKLYKGMNLMEIKNSCLKVHLASQSHIDTWSWNGLII